MHILLAAMALILLIAILIQGVVYLFTHFWIVLLVLALASTAAWLYFRHPGVKLKRELRQVAKSGQQQRGDIKEATAQAKADMEQIARNWKSWR